MAGVKTTLEGDASGLTKPFQEAVGAVGELRNELSKLQRDLNKASSFEAIADVNQQIKNTKALLQSLINPVKESTGLLEKLNDRVKRLTLDRDAAKTTEEIIRLNREIATTNEEISGLKNLGRNLSEPLSPIQTLRQELRKLQNDLLNAKTPEEFKRIREEAEKVRDKMQAIGRLGISFSDTLRGQLTQLVYGFLAVNFVANKLQEFFKDAIKNNAELSVKVQNLDAAYNKLSGSIGKTINSVDEAVGITTDLNRATTTLANIFDSIAEHDGVIQFFRRLSGALLPVVGAIQFIGDVGDFFGISGETTTGKSVFDIAIRQKEIQKKKIDQLKQQNDNNKKLEQQLREFRNVPALDQGLLPIKPDFSGQLIPLDVSTLLINDFVRQSNRKIFNNQFVRTSRALQGIGASTNQFQNQIFQINQGVQAGVITQQQADAAIEKIFNIWDEFDTRAIQSGEMVVENYINIFNPFLNNFQQAFLNSGKGFGKSMLRSIEAIEARLAASAVFSSLINIISGGRVPFTKTFSKLTGLSFAGGGDTGPGLNFRDSSGFRVAGIVHEHEYVTPKSVVNDPIGSALINELEYIRRKKKGFADGGYTTPQGLPPTTLGTSQQAPVFIIQLESEGIAQTVDYTIRKRVGKKNDRFVNADA